MTATVFGAVTRKNVRVAPATVFNASSSDAFRRSTVIGISRNTGSKMRLMLAKRLIARPLDQRLQLGFAFLMHGDLRPKLVPGGAQLLFDIAAGGIQFGGGFIFDQRFVE